MAEKIFILGAPGSGKTTLAKKLSDDLKINYLSLDNWRYPQVGVKKTDQELIKKAKDLADQEKWIVEGFYITWTKDLLDKADQIIYLDVPTHKLFFRSLLRWAKLHLNGDHQHGFKSMYLMLKHIWKFNKDITDDNLLDDHQITRFKIKKALSIYQDKVIYK